ncbi:Phenylalanine--tRNA ligase [Saliniradius amylolyticus]|uniref:Phenylalanine--tRNA ligase beta subunit n=1 Tax=Saliniradius amylolyticus TaxID=2183582 RepID=A0A2S2E2H5_9ALTE|nr:phenylalanine--tRNA ligase subunit beta [Saliniradius amylolyticus]AWL11833.1 Phenylalanine--tRNA ligase [Saliniradius amylolyticus]
MKFSEQWLREWVSPQVSTEELAEQITMAGLEVDAIEPVAPAFSGVVVGEVVECGPHPDADKLQVTKVNAGDEELLDIVCGAPNCRQGLKVVVAKVGAVLPGDFKIKKAKLRGQPSHGMLCSASELGLSEDHDGITELPEDAPIGVDIRDYMQLDDVSIEVDLTPNRADCLGLKGLAREVGVLNQQDVLEPQVNDVAAMIDDKREIRLVNGEACPRYLGRVIKGINPMAKTPLWMQEKLRRSGIRSIDPVVDVTNFVLLELGHPMHAFDNDVLSGDIQVRNAKAGEKLVLLDGEEVELKEDTLLIADQEKPLAMAGIFGGKGSGVTEQTQNIFLESAFFAPDAIMGRARQYGLHTDASHRYERGVDPTLQFQAMERATRLLLDIVGGQAGPITEAVDEQYLPGFKNVHVRRERLDRVLGMHIDDDRVTDCLKRLGFMVEFDGQKWQVDVPPYRFDIDIEEDLIEEIVRVYGYHRVEPVAPMARLSMAPTSEQQLPLVALKQRLTSLGYQEAITYSFVDPKAQEALFPASGAWVLPHPISVDMSAMRVSLWPGLLQAVSYNQNRQQQRVALFETGLRFVVQDGKMQQQPMISGVLAGQRHQEHWDKANAGVDFFDIKAVVESLIQLTGAENEFSFRAAEHSALHPGQSAEILRQGEVIGWLGAVHPQFEKQLGLKGRAFVFELHQDALCQRRLPQARKVSNQPANRRDIALVVDEAVAAGDVLDAIEKVGGNQLVALNLFDIYRGDALGENNKSLAISLTLQHAERTLEEQEIQATVEQVVAHLSEHFGATLRD